VADSILRARKFLKLKDTFVNSIREHQTEGRIHCTFHQSRGGAAFDTDDESGAAFGRLSCTDPNLQQQPARDPEIGKMWRSIYVPDEGKQWASIDFSAQEPRLATHFAVIAGCEGAEEFAWAWNKDPRMDMHKTVGTICSISRDAAKTTNLGVMYGMGGGKLCRSLGLPTEKWIDPRGIERDVAGPEGKILLAAYERQFPFLKQLAKMATKRAEDIGYVRTILGRHCHFPESGGKYQDTHKALSRVIQGSAADQMKQSLINCDKAGIEVQLSIHDELCLSVKDHDEAMKVRDVMVNAIELLVPSVCDVAIGSSWGEAE
jgi:DNA polymerase I-like protein with 3'-5' exonuclease and polymerase domains